LAHVADDRCICAVMDQQTVIVPRGEPSLPPFCLASTASKVYASVWLAPISKPSESPLISSPALDQLEDAHWQWSITFCPNISVAAVIGDAVILESLVCPFFGYFQLSLSFLAFSILKERRKWGRARASACKVRFVFVRTLTGVFRAVCLRTGRVSRNFSTRTVVPTGREVRFSLSLRQRKLDHHP